MRLCYFEIVKLYQKYLCDGFKITIIVSKYVVIRSNFLYKKIYTSYKYVCILLITIESTHDKETTIIKVTLKIYTP